MQLDEVTLELSVAKFRWENRTTTVDGPNVFQITYSAVKEFVDAQGVTQVQKIPATPRVVSNRETSYIIEELRPFTTYTVNVTAVPQTSEYRPPAKITVTTQMAGKAIAVQDLYILKDLLNGMFLDSIQYIN